MKHIIEILILLAVIASIAALTSCSPEEDASSAPPKPPDPHEVLREQVKQERELRKNAEARADEADSDVTFWESASVFLFVVACIAFLSGTSIGSKGRKHADS